MLGRRHIPSDLMAISAHELTPVLVKGIIPEMETQISAISTKHRQGAASSDLTGNSIVIGKELAETAGPHVGDRALQCMSPVTDRWRRSGGASERWV